MSSKKDPAALAFSPKKLPFFHRLQGLPAALRKKEARVGAQMETTYWVRDGAPVENFLELGTIPQVSLFDKRSAPIFRHGGGRPHSLVYVAGGHSLARFADSPHLAQVPRHGSSSALQRPQYLGASVSRRGTANPQRPHLSELSSVYAPQFGQQISAPSPRGGKGYFLRNS